MKILIPAAIATMFFLQACNGDNNSSTDSKMMTDTTMKMLEHNDAKMDGARKLEINNQ